MSVYNGERFLPVAVESILSQTFNDLEFIIVNDGSTDSSSEILYSYSKHDRRIRIIRNENNIGLTRSLNKALLSAKGGYIARMDADDIASSDRLEKQVDFMDNHPDVVLLGTAFYEINASGEELNRKRFPVSDKEIRGVLIRYNPFCHSSILIRRSALDVTGFYDDKIATTQDYDLWFRLARTGKIANLPDYLMKRRYEGENISIARENEQLRWAIIIRKTAIKKRYYPLASYIHLIRPYIALMTPFFIRKAVRKHFLKNRMYD